VAPSFSRQIKVTFGTGGFLLWDTGEDPLFSDQGLLTTVAYQMGSKAKPHYAIEGSIAYAGATIDWLRDNLRLFSTYDDLETLAGEAYSVDPGNFF
ncbi:unnamed protein product, partial [Protopolystoma xenopodis]